MLRACLLSDCRHVNRLFFVELIEILGLQYQSIHSSVVLISRLSLLKSSYQFAKLFLLAIDSSSQSVNFITKNKTKIDSSRSRSDEIS